jgi:hypothetical protein
VQAREDRRRTASPLLRPRRRASRQKTDDDQGESEQDDRDESLDGRVSVQLVDGRLTDGQTDAARDQRAEQEAAEEGDRVRSTSPASCSTVSPRPRPRAPWDSRRSWSPSPVSRRYANPFPFTGGKRPGVAADVSGEGFTSSTRAFNA